MGLAALFSMLFFFVAMPAREEALFMLRSLAWTPVVMLAYGILLNLLKGFPLLISDMTGANRLSASAGPAFLAAASYASAIAAAFLLVYTRQARYMFLIVISLACAALSGTRMPAIAAIASALLISLMYFKHGVMRIGVVLSSIVIIGVFLLTVGDQIILRFQFGSDSGRQAIWSIILFWIDFFPFAGVGFGHQSLLIPAEIERLTTTNAAHNEYLRILVELGYPFAIIFFLGIILTFTAHLSRIDKSARFCFYSSLCLYFMYSWTDNTLLVSYALLIPIAIAIGSALIQSERGLASVSPANGG